MTIQWDGDVTDRGAIQDPGTTLANATSSAFGSKVDNPVNLDSLGWFELKTSSGDRFSVADSLGTVDLYSLGALDGTTYENTPDIEGELGCMLRAPSDLSGFAG